MGWVMTMAWGWATLPLFGRIQDARRAALLAALWPAAALWLAAAAGILLPDAVAAFLTAAGLPDGTDTAPVRSAMTALVVVIPACVGVASRHLLPAEQRPRGRAALQMMVLGYPLTIGLALVLPLLAVAVPLLAVRRLVRGWSGEYVPFQSRLGDEMAMLHSIGAAFHAAGLHIAPASPPALLSLPHALVRLFGGGSLGPALPERLAQLRGDTLEMRVYPSSLVISGSREERGRARAALARGLGLTYAWLTWSADGRALEDRLAAVLRLGTALHSLPMQREQALYEVEQVRRALPEALLDTSEWDVVERLCLLTEVRVLRAGGVTATAPVALGPEPGPEFTPAERASVTQTEERTVTAAAPEPVAPAVHRSMVNPTAVMAALTAAAVVLWRISGDGSQAEAFGEG